MEKEELLNQVLSDTKSIFQNIQWNMGGLAGIAALIAKPQMYFTPNIPLRIDIDGLNIDLYQCLGISLLEKDRSPRIDELLASAKRSLICESLEITADALVRTSRIILTGKDPYRNENYFNAEIKELWNSSKGKAGGLITKNQGQFFDKCIAPLRNFIRHHNGLIPPNKEIIYSGTPLERNFDISYVWKNNQDNNIKITLEIAFYLFESISQICLIGIKNGIESIKN